MKKQIGHIHWEKVRVSHKKPPVYMQDGEVIMDIPYEVYEYVPEDRLIERLRTAIRKQLRSKGIQTYVDSDSITDLGKDATQKQLRWAKYRIYHIEEEQMKAINQWIADTWNWRFAHMSPQTQRVEMSKWDQTIVSEQSKATTTKPPYQ